MSIQGISSTLIRTSIGAGSDYSVFPNEISKIEEQIDSFSVNSSDQKTAEFFTKQLNSLDTTRQNNSFPTEDASRILHYAVQVGAIGQFCANRFSFLKRAGSHGNCSFSSFCPPCSSEINQPSEAQSILTSIKGLAQEIGIKYKADHPLYLETQELKKLIDTVFLTDVALIDRILYALKQLPSLLEACKNVRMTVLTHFCYSDLVHMDIQPLQDRYRKVAEDKKKLQTLLSPKDLSLIGTKIPSLHKHLISLFSAIEAEETDPAELIITLRTPSLFHPIKPLGSLFTQSEQLYEALFALFLNGSLTNKNAKQIQKTCEWFSRETSQCETAFLAYTQEIKRQTPILHQDLVFLIKKITEYLKGIQTLMKCQDLLSEATFFTKIFRENYAQQNFLVSTADLILICHDHFKKIDWVIEEITKLGSTSSNKKVTTHLIQQKQALASNLKANLEEMHKKLCDSSPIGRWSPFGGRSF